MDRLCNFGLETDMSIRRAAEHVSAQMQLLSVSKRTIHRWYSHWLAFNMLPCETPKTYLKSHRGTVFSNESLQALKHIVDECPVLYLDEIAKKLKLLFNKKFGIKSISVALRVELKYSRKVVYEKASQQIARDKENFIATLRFHLKNPEMAIFVDESNKDRKAARRKYGWSKVGVQVNFRTPFNVDIRYTFIGAATCYGFYIPACHTVLHSYKGKEEDKPVDADTFVQYVRLYLVPSLGNYSLNQPRSVVIMDNCAIHLDLRVKELIEGAGAILVYSAPYCPEVIPIEYMFHNWKAYLKRHFRDFDEDWWTNHNLAISSITPEQGLNFFKKTTLTELVAHHPLLNVEENRRKIMRTLLMIEADVI